MRATLERIEKNHVSLQVEVEAAQVDEALERAYRKVVKEVNIPGFRKGRVPRPILEARLGKQILYEEALETLLSQAYQEAVQQTAIEPIDQPRVDVIQMEAGRPLIFKAVVEVTPEVKLGPYKGVAAVMPEVKVGNEEVEAHLSLLQHRHCQLVDVGEGPVDDGDVVIISYEATIEGIPEPRLSGQEEAVEVGSGKFIPGFEAHLLGAKTGEEKKFKLTLPSLFKFSDLVGKEADFRVQIKAVKRKELSPLDDEFARDVSDCATLAELKEHIRNKLEETGHLHAKRIFTERVVQKVVAQSEVEVPQVLVERQLEQDFSQLAQRLAIQRMTLDQYLQMIKKDFEALKADFEAKAREVIKERLVLGVIAKTEGLTVNPEEIDAEIKDLAAQYGRDETELQKQLEAKNRLDMVEESVFLEKARKFLVEHALVLPDRAELPREESPKDEPVQQESDEKEVQVGQGVGG